MGRGENSLESHNAGVGVEYPREQSLSPVKHENEDYAEYVRLLISHQTNIRAYIISRMPGVTGVSDVLQETNLVLWKKREQFEIGSNFSAWAFAIARNKTLSHLRKLRRDQRPVLDEGLVEELSNEFAAESGELDAWFDALDGCVGKLTREQRSLLEFRYRSGRELQEYPSKSSVGALRGRLHRIRAALRDCINSTLRVGSYAR